jgi:endonuclease/exonuclease/phosphatase family metal-dependent hydrolase
VAVVAVAGWLVFVLAHQVLSGRLRYWAPLDLAPPLVFAVMPVLLLALAMFARPVRWRLAGVLAVAAAVGAGNTGLNPAALWYSPPPAPPGAFTLFAWNTEFWDQLWRTDGGRPGDGRTDTAGFYRYLLDQEADVYLLQEYLHLRRTPGQADQRVRIDRLAELTERFPGYEIAVFGELVTLSRFPIVFQRPLDLRPWLPEPMRAVPPEFREVADYYTTKTLRTDLRVAGGVVSVYNSHIHQPSHHFDLWSRAARDHIEDRHARRWAAYQAMATDVADNGNPIVVAGDFNTSPVMGVLRMLPDRLVDHTRALDSLYPASWAAEDDEFWRLDWLLTTPNVAVHGYEMRRPYGQSDHSAQWAEVSLGG